jgi:hypothetical protein
MSTLTPAGLVKVRSGKRGSGWAIGSVGVLTARHVIEPFLHGQVDHCWAVLDPSPEGPGFDCEVIFQDEDRDLALLRVLDVQASAWQLRLGAERAVLAEPGSRGLPVEVVGFPDATLGPLGIPNPEAATATLLPAGGAVSGRMPLDVSNSVPETSKAWQGMSGAGVRDAVGRLLGVVVEVAGNWQHRRMYAAVLPDPRTDHEFAAALRQVDGPQYLEAINAPRARQLLQLIDPSGRPYPAAQIPGLDLLGVRFSRTDIDTGGDPFYPYMPREVDSELDAALDARAAGSDKRLLLVVGNAMAGKSRSLAEAVRRHARLRSWLLLRPEVNAALEEAVDLGAASEMLVWLDDLDRYLPRISADLLRRLLSRSGLAVLATIRTERLSSLGESDLRSSWEIINDATLRQSILLSAGWTESEQSPLQNREQVLRDALGHGRSLGEALAAGHEMVRRLENAPSDLHKALTNLIADWLRTGIPTPLPDTEAVRLWRIYLPEARAKWLTSLSNEDLGRQFREVRDWLCQPVAGSTTTAVQRRGEGLVIDGLFIQRRTDQRAVVPREVFERALTAAARAKDPEPVMLTIAYQAAAAGLTSIAEEVWTPLAASGNQDARHNRQVISRYIRAPARIIVQAPDRAHAGTTITALVVGRLLRNADVKVARVYVNCVIKYHYWTIDIKTFKVGKREITVPFPIEETATKRIRAGVSDLLIRGTLPVGYAFSELVHVAIPNDAIGQVSMPNIEVFWEVVAELSAKGRRARHAMPLVVVPVAKRRPASPEILADDIVALSFSGLPEGPVYAGDRFNGIMHIQARQDFAASAITIQLVLYSEVRRLVPLLASKTYPIHHSAKQTEFRAGQSVKLPFSVTIPSSPPAPSIDAYNVTKFVRFSTQWYLEGRIDRQSEPKLTIRFRITVA